MMDFVLLEVDKTRTPDPSDTAAVAEWASDILAALATNEPNEMPCGVRQKWARSMHELCPIDLVRERKKQASERALLFADARRISR